MNNVSLVTIALSAVVSVVTGYVGTLLNFRRQRDRARRTYGLAILSEIKSLQRALRTYHRALGSEPPGVRAARMPRLHLTTADLNVFGFNSGNIGLFSVRTAVEVIELYSRVRALIAQSQALGDAALSGERPHADAAIEMDGHVQAVVLVRQQSRAVSALLRAELPVLPEERLRYLRRRSRLVMHDLLRSMRPAPREDRRTPPMEQPGAP